MPTNHHQDTQKSQPSCALVLPGGGARAAYQAGVIKAIGELVPRDGGNPFPVISGTSAGAINAAMLASHAGQFKFAASRLADIWMYVAIPRIYRVDGATVMSQMLRWLAMMVTGGRFRRAPRSLLDNSPLRELLNDNIDFGDIKAAIDEGALQALALTASGYTSAHSVTFFDGHDGLREWQRERREGRRTRITLEHIMASIALPIIFPSVVVDGEYYGDGSMRQAAPLSAPIHLGAKKILTVSVRDNAPNEVVHNARGPVYPSLGQITGYVFDTLFLDSLDADLERLHRINQTCSAVPESAREDAPDLNVIDTFTIAPSRDIREIAGRHRNEFPRAMRGLLKRLGAHHSSGDQLISYLLFSDAFCGELVELGYRDAMARQFQIREFLGYPE